MVIGKKQKQQKKIHECMKQDANMQELLDIYAGIRVRCPKGFGLSLFS